VNAICHDLRVLFFLLLAFFSASPLFAEDGTILLTGDVQMKIADAFMEEGEYYRAVTEYKRFLILFPNSEKANYATSRIGLSHFKGEEFGTAVRCFSIVRQKYPESEYAVEASYLEGGQLLEAEKLHQGAGDAGNAGGREPCVGICPPRAPGDQSLTALDNDSPGPSRRALERVLDRYPQYPNRESVKEAEALIDRYQEQPQKSPVLAGILSAILAGSGYLYAERYGDGLTAFLINGLFIAGTVMAFHAENYALGTIVGGVGLPFYLGNIYGSANAVKKVEHRSET
jgi:hypothetical protein